jgi:hypothetical protein
VVLYDPTARRGSAVMRRRAEWLDDPPGLVRMRADSGAGRLRWGVVTAPGW